MLTASMLNHPSTTPHIKRAVYLPRLSAHFVLMPHPVTASTMQEDKADDFIGVAIESPATSDDVFILNLYPDDPIILITEDDE